MGIFLFYVIFILLEFRFFKNKLDLMITDRKRKSEVFGLIERIKKDVNDDQELTEKAKENLLNSISTIAEGETK